MEQDEGRRWSFLTNHAGALLCIAHDPGIRLREIADAIGITERAAPLTQHPRRFEPAVPIGFP